MKTTRTVTHRHIDMRDITVYDDNGKIVSLSAQTEDELRVLVAAALDVPIGSIAGIRCVVTGDLVGLETNTNADYGGIQQDCIGHHWVFESQMIERFDEEP